jgi:hypothetical protein
VPDAISTVELFYAELARLTPRQWLSIVTGVPIDEYEAEATPGRTAVEAFLAAPSDPEVVEALQLAQPSKAIEVTNDLWPDLSILRADMRPHAVPGASDLSEEGYELFRSEAARRVWWAAASVAMAGALEDAGISRLYRPFEGFIPLSSLLDPPPDFARDLARCLLISSRWAVERGPGSDSEKTGYWSAVVPRWLWLFNGGDMPGIGIPSPAISRAFMTALSGFLRDSGPKQMRYVVLPLIREAEAVRFNSDEQIAEALAEFQRWQMPRLHRRWIASRITRLMQAVLMRELVDGTKTVEPHPESAALTGAALVAMGFEPADREPPPPPGGLLVLPEAFTWWEPAPVDLSEENARRLKQSGPGAVLLPPEAQRRNLMTMLEPDHFNPALEWYAAEVLPFIDDYASGPTSSKVPEIGLSRFVAAIPYGKQQDTVRLFLWTLADCLLVAAQTREANGRDAAPFHRNRLPLIRAIWSEEVNAATDVALGISEATPLPELGGPTFSASLLEWGDTRERVESGMRRFLKLPSTEGNAATDDLSSFEIVAAARAAAYLRAGAAASRRGVQRLRSRCSVLPWQLSRRSTC